MCCLKMPAQPTQHLDKLTYDPNPALTFIKYVDKLLFSNPNRIFCYGNYCGEGL